MDLNDIKVCPGTLAEGFVTYSPGCLRKMFGGKKVSHILPFQQPLESEEVTLQFWENRKHISISGMQEKLSFVLDKNKLRLTNEGEPGTYILKPIPRDLKAVSQVPANEHLTMQIAKQVYGIKTAENALIFFTDGAPAYLTKRFDANDNGEKFGVEDFATLAGKTNENAGSNFKYDFSYEEIGALIQEYVPAWKVEAEKFFRLVVFNYLFSNGDAHLKNFSILESSQGDHLLSPAYDLLNTKLHVADTGFALENGLFADTFTSAGYKKNGQPNKEDFMEFARRIGVGNKRAEKLISPFLAEQGKVEDLTRRSFLNKEYKERYLELYVEKQRWLND